jgi:hypothetical protein
VRRRDDDRARARSHGAAVDDPGDGAAEHS